VNGLVNNDLQTPWPLQLSTNLMQGYSWDSPWWIILYLLWKGQMIDIQAAHTAVKSEAETVSFNYKEAT
jgi:hypothetical protein